MDPVTIGNIQVQRVEELMWEISPRFLFPDLSYEYFEKYRDWLVPHFSTEELKLRLSIHTFVIKTPHHTILVDTCIGNDRKRDVPMWDHMSSDYLARLTAAGVNPEEVDYVMCTHMHVDHVGWNTRLENGVWVPTFPNARYLFHKKEWDYWNSSEKTESETEVVKDSLLPVIDAGLADMVDADFAIEDILRLEPTPGHTPGHCSIHLGGTHADGVITGDMIHHPFQIAEPDKTSRACIQPELAIKTRQAFVDRYADTSTLILGTHFAPPTALHIVGTPNGCRVKTV